MSRNINSSSNIILYKTFCKMLIELTAFCYLPFFQTKKGEYICVCRSGEFAGIQRCDKGRKVIIADRYWAGDLDSSLEPEKSPYVFPKDRFFHPNNTPIYPTKGDFTVALCNNGWCARISRGWIFPQDYPCDQTYQHIGPLCGACRKGEMWTLGQPVIPMKKKALRYVFKKV